VENIEKVKGGPDVHEKLFLDGFTIQLLFFLAKAKESLGFLIQTTRSQSDHISSKQSKAESIELFKCHSDSNPFRRQMPITSSSSIGLRQIPGMPCPDETESFQTVL
jgi:hypothetical protein